MIYPSFRSGTFGPKLKLPVDPWRPVTPHSDEADDREDTILRPFKLIPGTLLLV